MNQDNSTPNISGHRLLVTRPAIQASSLITLLKQQGIITLALPMLEIQPLSAHDIDTNKILNLDQYDAIITVSANAAKIGAQLINTHWSKIPRHIQWFAIGNTTATELSQLVDNVYLSDKGITTESLLTLPALTNSNIKQILILKGIGGRKLLQNSLTKMGRLVDTIDLYRRIKPSYSRIEIEQLFMNGLPDSILVTSNESLNNLCDILHNYIPQLIHAKLITISDRISNMAQKKGFKYIYTAKSASAQAIIQTLNAIA